MLKRELFLDTHLAVSIDSKDSVPLVQQFTGICNVNRGLLFITSQHPDLNASFTESFNGIWHSFLQTIFNTSSTWNTKQSIEESFSLN